MYTLYASKNTYSMSAHLLLEELQVDYQVNWFDVTNVDDHPDEFKDINPNLTVPVIVTKHGPINESAAILVYLAEQHGHTFMPTIDDPLRSQFWQWQFFLMSTLQPEVLNQFHPDRYLPDTDSGQKLLLDSSMLKIQQIWQLIDDNLANRHGYLCESYSVCDMLFAMQAIWTESRPPNLSNYPNIVKLLTAIYSRSAAKVVLGQHEVDGLAQIIFHQFEQIDHQKDTMQ